MGIHAAERESLDPGTKKILVVDESGIKLIALTGYGQASDRDKAQSAGFDRHLVKLIDFDALRKTREDI